PAMVIDVNAPQFGVQVIVGVPVTPPTSMRWVTVPFVHSRRTNVLTPDSCSTVHDAVVAFPASAQENVTIAVLLLPHGVASISVSAVALCASPGNSCDTFWMALWSS